MAEFSESAAPVFEAGEIQRVAALFGGPKMLRRTLRNPLDVHEAISEGLPGEAVVRLAGNLPGLRGDDLEAALGMSVRTVQRLKHAPHQRLSRAQSSQVWALAKILAQAIAVLGSREAAAQWLASPAMALDRRRPIELLATTAGAAMVEDLLGRIAYGVYT